MGDALGMHVGDTVGSGEGLPYLYVGSEVGDSVGNIEGLKEGEGDGCGVGLP